MFRKSMVLCGALLLGQIFLPAYAQDNPSSEQIIDSLAKKKPLTRSLGGVSAADRKDSEFLKSLPTRGLEIQQREELMKVVERQKLPSIDIQIEFELNSANLTPDATKSLNQLGRALLSPDLAKARIALNGHTDASGSDEHNQKLSDQRALAVQHYLADTFGAERDRLVVTGHGEKRLKDTHDPNGAANRRVEVINLGAY